MDKADRVKGVLSFLLNSCTHYKHHGRFLLCKYHNTELDNVKFNSVSLHRIQAI